MVSSASILPQSPAFYETGRPNSLIRKVQNVLTGRIFMNWKEQLLSVATVYCIINAAMLFFTGYWFSAFSHFFLGAFLAILRKEIKDITNLRKERLGLAKENDVYRLANTTHRKLLDETKKENKEYKLANETHKQLLSDFNEKLSLMEGENARFSKNNDVFETGLARMGSCMTEIATAIENGTQVSEEFLCKAIREFDSARVALDTAKNNIEQTNSSHRDQIEQLFATASRMNDSLLKKAGALQRKYETTKTDLAKIVIDLKNATKERQRLAEEVERLKKVRGSIERSADRVESATSKLEFLITPLWKQSKAEMAKNVVIGAAVAKVAEVALRKIAHAAAAA